MKTKELICVVCPNGCQLEVQIQEGETLQVGEITGSLCEKGPDWAEQEILNPMRTIASSVRVEHGDFPLVSVRTNAPIPLGKIFDVMKAIKELVVEAPVRIGDRLLENPAGTSCAVIATRNVHPVINNNTSPA